MVHCEFGESITIITQCPARKPSLPERDLETVALSVTKSCSRKSVMNTNKSFCSRHAWKDWVIKHRHHTTLGIPLLCILAVLSVVFAGCSPNTNASAPIRIGLNAWPGYEFLYLAQEKQFFKEAGVEVKLVELTSLADARRAYERGLIDGLGTTLIDTLQARHARTPGPQVVWVADYSDGADVIVARNDLSKVSDLQGKKVGVEMVSLGVYILSQALEKSNLHLKDVIAVYMDQASMANALKSGTLDAVVTYPPTSVTLQNEGVGKVLFSTAELPGEVMDVLAIDTTIVAERMEEVRRLLTAFSKAVNFTKSNPQEAYAIMARRERISPEEFKDAMESGMKILTLEDQQPFLGPEGRIVSILNKVNAVMRQAEMIQGADRLTGSFVDNCLPKAARTTPVAARHP